ncbi:sensor histidine kinase [Streptomyces sp. SKN60]|uniref:sensor histidine kinase n=1 Tax=Streptomyces sp. SKN60 TaxID=2855506 RepID=UPI002246AFB4|nr:sensor domain-containing protein [Streptomyces sp. SKN60]
MGRVRGAWTALVRCQRVSLRTLVLPLYGSGVVLALLLLPVGLGFPLLPPAAAALRRRSDARRARLARWSGLDVAAPGPLPRTARAVLGDEGFWRDLRWAWLEPLTGGLLVAVPLSLFWFGVFGAVVQPFVWRELGDGNWYAFVPVVSPATAVAAALLGLGFVAGAVALAPWTLARYARWSRRALSVPYETVLARRIDQLTGTRADALDFQAAELRRIERDLHDGAQARLVALGMTLAEAARRLDEDPAAARALLADAREVSERALGDLRELVHGILPPVLADRGLGDAVRSLALDSFLDVAVDTAGLPPGRLPAAVESAAYFAVAELLANAAKHAGAREVRIVLGHTGGADGLLRVTVADDGHGGAAPAPAPAAPHGGGPHGGGLHGVRRRLRAFDGTLALDSPPGGPTLATLEIPCASSSPKTSSSSGTG